MKQLLIATGNKGKLREISALLEPLKVEVIPQHQLNISDAEETGLTFIENAIIKARHACQQSGLPALADDSGLEVDALNGAPGIYSARFAGPASSDQQNYEKLLQQLADKPRPWHARYHCVMVLMQHHEDPTPLICHGTLEGEIIEQPAGSNGFGYDPIFWLNEHQATAAQLPSELKNSISHRGLALQQLLSQLQDRPG